MKVLVWATTLGADLWSLTRYLDQRADVDVRVVLKQPERFAQEPLNELFPLKASLVARTAAVMARGIPGFSPDITVFDNEVPPPGHSRAGFALWHGYGWKGPNDVPEMRALYLQIRMAWGNPRKPNRKFGWLCFGPKDFAHRTTVAGLHPDNCHQLGAASHDDLRIPLAKAMLQPHYPFDIVQRKTVLIAPTWHYGEVFSHWGGDSAVLQPLLAWLEQQGCNVILRLHDSFRFDKSYRSFLNGLAQRHSNVLLKFKDECPDNLLDMQASDVLLTNFSSIANLFYATGRPVVHIYPVASADEQFLWRKRTVFGMFTRRVEKARYIWKFPPEENGGLLARGPEQLQEQLQAALVDPALCQPRCRDFLDTEMLSADGGNCERIFTQLRRLVDSSQPAAAEA